MRAVFIWPEYTCSVSVFDGKIVSNKQVPNLPRGDAQIAPRGFLMPVNRSGVYNRSMTNGEHPGRDNDDTDDRNVIDATDRFQAPRDSEELRRNAETRRRRALEAHLRRSCINLDLDFPQPPAPEAPSV
jgi:hypothetical protein